MRILYTEWIPNVSEFVIDEAAGDVNGGRETEVEGGVALKVDNGDGVMGNDEMDVDKTDTRKGNSLCVFSLWISIGLC